MLVAGMKTQKIAIPDQTMDVSALSLISVTGAVTKCFGGNRGTLVDSACLNT